MMFLATLVFVACKPTNEPNKPVDDDEDEYVAPITIDGDAAEWTQLGSKVFTADCNPNAEKKALFDEMVANTKAYLGEYK